jgi:flagellar hook assembly protein FlgD
MFFVPTAEEMNISIFNILGHRVFSDIMNIPPGLTTITWDGRDDDGQNLPTGIYFYHLSTEKKQMLNKITILK